MDYFALIRAWLIRWAWLPAARVVCSFLSFPPLNFIQPLFPLSHSPTLFQISLRIDRIRALSYLFHQPCFTECLPTNNQGTKLLPYHIRIDYLLLRTDRTLHSLPQLLSIHRRHVLYSHCANPLPPLLPEHQHLGHLFDIYIYVYTSTYKPRNIYVTSLSCPLYLRLTCLRAHR